VQDTNAKASIAHLSAKGVGVAALTPYPPGPDDHELGSLRQALVSDVSHPHTAGASNSFSLMQCKHSALLCKPIGNSIRSRISHSRLLT